MRLTFVLGPPVPASTLPALTNVILASAVDEPGTHEDRYLYPSQAGRVAELKPDLLVRALTMAAVEEVAAVGAAPAVPPHEGEAPDSSAWTLTRLRYARLCLQDNAISDDRIPAWLAVLGLSDTPWSRDGGTLGERQAVRAAVDAACNRVAALPHNEQPQYERETALWGGRPWLIWFTSFRDRARCPLWSTCACFKRRRMP